MGISEDINHFSQLPINIFMNHYFCKKNNDPSKFDFGKLKIWILKLAT